MIDNIMGSACVQEIREQIEFFEISDFVEFKRKALIRQQVKAYDPTPIRYSIRSMSQLFC